MVRVNLQSHNTEYMCIHTFCAKHGLCGHTPKCCFKYGGKLIDLCALFVASAYLHDVDCFTGTLPTSASPTTNCTTAGHTSGCCVGITECTVSRPGGDCYCDVGCYLDPGSCCEDIQQINCYRKSSLLVHHRKMQYSDKKENYGPQSNGFNSNYSYCSTN